jgi:mannose-1-phosphate guanylyltransferase/mannose-6-phosphate isomerase
MKSPSITPVILCGGSGSRLWPVSRNDFPKQFLDISGELSLFQETCLRLQQLNPKFYLNETLVVTNEEHRFLAIEQLKSIKINDYKLLLEPSGKNTAPALTLAALKALSNKDDPVLLVTPADHIIKDDKAFQRAVSTAIDIANNGSIVVLGIKPSRPETGFGYIKQEHLKNNVFKVLEFKEKPSLSNAKNYLDSGQYSWNSGIFIMKASLWLEALNKFRPDILTATQKSFDQLTEENQFIRPNTELFAKIPSESIDYAVMEKLGKTFSFKLVTLDAGWSDLGCWEALWDVSVKNNEGNVIRGDVAIKDTKDSLIYGTNRLIVASGLKDTIVIETADSVLVINKNQSQAIKPIVEELVRKKRYEYKSHRKVTRPWGWFDTLDYGDRFKVKRIQVNPGASLSLQSHKNRAEHWVVVKGIANIICGNKALVLKENESTYIPAGIKHKLSNQGKDILEIIEVQSGVYLGEDDIERFEDNYGRIK